MNSTCDFAGQVRSVAPALERHTHERLIGEIWNRDAYVAAHLEPFSEVFEAF